MRPPVTIGAAREMVQCLAPLPCRSRQGLDRSNSEELMPTNALQAAASVAIIAFVLAARGIASAGEEGPTSQVLFFEDYV